MAKKISDEGKTTVIFGQLLFDNISVQALIENLGFAELVRRVMTDYLKSQGLEPDRKPTLTVTYKE